MSLKAYDLVASSKGELERTRRYSAFARKCSVGGDGSGCGGGGGGAGGGGDASSHPLSSSSSPTPLLILTLLPLFFS